MKIKMMIIILVLAAAFLLGFTGTADFAGTEAENGERDVLAGVLVTPGYLDLFDADSFLSDNIGQLTNGGELSPEDTAAYQGRLYANKTVSEYTDDDGTVHEKVNYEFKGLKGFLTGCVRIGEGEEAYVTSLNDPCFSDVSFHINSAGESESYQISSTLYVNADGYMAYYFNPVYMTPEGEMYAVNGNGFSMSGEQGEGAAMTKTLKEEYTIGSEGKTTGLSVEVTVIVSVMLPPEKIVILHYDRTGALLERQEYRPDTLPESLTPGADTAYIVAESYKTDSEGRELVDYVICGRTDDALETFRCRDDGVCVKNYTTLDWGE